MIEGTGSIGTVGYCSPQQRDPSVGRTFHDDIYAIGATIVSIASGTDASRLPDILAVALIEHRREPSNHALAVAARCLAADQAERYASTADLGRDLLLLEGLGGSEGATSLGHAPTPRCDRHEFLGLAQGIGDSLLETAQRDADGLFWISKHPIVGGNPGRDLYAGSAGTALFLTALYGATRIGRYLEAAVECANWLHAATTVVPRQGSMSGLYFGDCGPGLLYLRIFEATERVEWMDRALMVSERASEVPFRSPDILTGAAGTGLYHLMLWRAGLGTACLDRALAAARWLGTAQSTSMPAWRMPAGYEGLSGREYVGFAHGSAGVGYFLACCYMASEDAQIGALCTETAAWIVDQGISALGGAGLTWPVGPADDARPINWCHGAPGVARFLLQAYRAMGNTGYLEAARAAARMAGTGARWHGTTQCHGLAGNLEAVLDIALHDDRHRDSYYQWAELLGENLAAYQTEFGWPSETADVMSPDLMVGQAGVGAAFLRLADPTLPHLIAMP